MAKNNTSETPSVNIVGAGTFIEGDITTNGDMRIDGSLTGSINVKGKLVVGPSGSIEGEIICQNADISGTVKGKIGVAELLSLKSSSKLSGDIITNKIAIEPGAVFSGSCSMGGVIKDIKSGATEKAKLTEKTA
ncbi:MAG: cell shape determination protein CcmA [Bacteroidota bacterium]|nr:cell shape determination protein CcmA [Bacteroidota bacterium]